MAKAGRARRSQGSATAPRPPQAKAKSAGKAPAIQRLWPTPIGLHRYPGADKLNPMLVERFADLREQQQHERGEQPGRSSPAPMTCWSASTSTAGRTGAWRGH